MIVYLNISKSAEGKGLLNASFHKVPGKKGTLIDEPFHEISGKPVNFVTQFLKDLQSKNIPVRFYHCSPEVPPNVQAVLYKSLMNYWRVTLPENRALIKICKDLDNKNVFYALYFDSHEAQSTEYEPFAQSGNPITLAVKILETLDNGYRHPVDLEFEESISQELQDLFTEVVGIYNKSVESKIKS